MSLKQEVLFKITEPSAHNYTPVHKLKIGTIESIENGIISIRVREDFVIQNQEDEELAKYSLGDHYIGLGLFSFNIESLIYLAVKSDKTEQFEEIKKEFPMSSTQESIATTIASVPSTVNSMPSVGVESNTNSTISIDY